MGRLSQPLLGHGENKARGTRSATWLGGTSRRGAQNHLGRIHQPEAAGVPRGRPRNPGGGRRRRGTDWGAPAGDRAGAGPLGSPEPPGPGRAARQRTLRGPGPGSYRAAPPHSLARWLAPGWAGRRARPVARPESVESGLRAAANPAAPFAQPALPPWRPPPSARPCPAPHSRHRLRRRRKAPPTSRRRAGAYGLGRSARVPPISGERRRIVTGTATIKKKKKRLQMLWGFRWSCGWRRLLNGVFDGAG